jgi:hypothetical protein
MIWSGFGEDSDVSTTKPNLQKEDASYNRRMTSSTLASIMIIIMMFPMIAIYLARYRQHSPEIFSPKAAWLRASIYFCFCYLAGIGTGAFDALLSNPITTPEQIADKTWWWWVGGLIMLVTAAYWVIWARYTLRFDRQLDVIPQTVFGLMWGIASGLLFLSFYRAAEVIGGGWKQWQIWLLAYIMIAVWQWLWQDYYWDVYISPEHDSPWSVKFKVIATHIPNITACLIFFAIYENTAIFVILQTWALLGASLAMRMPAPWSQEVTPPATRAAGLFGLIRASGYVPDDPENDPYLKAAHMPPQT